MDKVQRDPIARVDFDEASYLGSEQDGVYWQAARGPDGFYVSAVVDCDTASFTDSLVTDDGPYPTEQEADEAGRGAAVEWCIDNRVPFEDEPG